MEMNHDETPEEGVPDPVEPNANDVTEPVGALPRELDWNWMPATIKVEQWAWNVYYFRVHGHSVRDNVRKEIAELKATRQHVTNTLLKAARRIQLSVTPGTRVEQDAHPIDALADKIREASKVLEKAFLLPTAILQELECGLEWGYGSGRSAATRQSAAANEFVTDLIDSVIAEQQCSQEDALRYVSATVCALWKSFTTSEQSPLTASQVRTLWGKAEDPLGREDAMLDQLKASYRRHQARRS